VLLALGGGGIAIVFAAVSLTWIRRLGASSVPRINEIAISGDVLLFTLTIAMVSGVLFGLAPAWRLARVDPQSQLTDEGRGAAAGDSVWASGGSLRRLLVVSELALSVVLLIAAGLLIRSFARLQEVPPGFNPGQVLTLELTMTGRKYNDTTGVLQAYRQLWERLQAIPGVRAAGGVTSLPLSQMFAWDRLLLKAARRPRGRSSSTRICGWSWGITFARWRSLCSKDGASPNTTRAKRRG